MEPPYPTTYWLKPGLILCGETPRDKADDVPQHKMTAILKAGIRTFIDLTEPDELLPYADIARAKAKLLGIDPAELVFTRHAIKDGFIPYSPDVMRAVLSQIRSSRDADRPVYIHCWGGVGRTGTVVGCFLREEHQWTGEEALAELTRCYKFCSKFDRLRSPENEMQRNYVKEWSGAATFPTQLSTEDPLSD